MQRLPGLLRDLLRGLAQALLGPYGLYWVYRCDAALAGIGDAGLELREVDEALLRDDPDPELREQAWYAGSGSTAFGLHQGGRLRALCFYWQGQRYASRGFWPLADGEAKLVQLFVTPQARGQGLAPVLIAGSAERMLAAGRTALFARVWHSNLPSLRAFERAGWQRVAFVVEINPLRRARPWRLRLPRRPSPAG